MPREKHFAPDGTAWKVIADRLRVEGLEFECDYPDDVAKDIIEELAKAGFRIEREG